ncbi:SDR family NAD(P)-dependent oxidoreductase [Chiayiivirga flava]|uniref:NAD(P)-dependent dehydrogenase (Short-subunit alcohol dehydrogenase family) n=1 Tax=Chiayiivirga flava TaxID=659595 RepID=A0A7W8G1Q0_9GAMM|nr:SDR family NAD(P)-dependent oxidoreductase [Chiayiivirga flava]MBB5207875.1 NAD(P)-dependent dehydrogenase (short-subunit alcohol dehydrogenase family) [Chiayiivirga flava]
MPHRASRRRFLHTALLVAAAPALARAAVAPAPAFGPGSTAEEVTRGLDLRGKTAVVTGCNSGLGFETMRVLAQRGAHVIGTARSVEKGRDACARIEGSATAVVLDLGNFESVVACTRAIAAREVPIDMLICNAGIVLGEHEQVYGLEKQFVVNHLGHFLFAHRLIDRVRAAPQGRVVVLGSGDHRNAPPGGIQFDRLSGEGWHERGYSHSKPANGLFSLELARRLRGSAATSNCVSPGHVRTNILRNVGNAYGAHARSVGHGAATPCYVAAHPAMAGISGAFLRDFAPAEQSAAQTDAAMAATLWQVSEELTRPYLS